ncbi:MAG: hypothetical protein AB1589_18745 [Cyanobacteriota bacterium]
MQQLMSVVAKIFPSLERPERQSQATTHDFTRCVPTHLLEV